MKNKKFIAVVLVLSMMLMGAGYAAWTQQFSVTAAVDTGTLGYAFDFTNTITDEGVEYAPVYSDYTVDSQELDTEGYADAILTENGTTDAEDYTVTLTDMYPGAVCELDGTLTNESTMQIKLETVDAASTTKDGYTFEWLVMNGVGNYVAPTAENTTLEPGVNLNLRYVITANDNLTNDDAHTSSLTFTHNYMQFNQ